jgi:hypothetical protein
MVMKSVRGQLRASAPVIKAPRGYMTHVNIQVATPVRSDLGVIFSPVRDEIQQQTGGGRSWQ